MVRSGSVVIILVDLEVITAIAVISIFDAISCYKEDIPRYTVS